MLSLPRRTFQQFTGTQLIWSSLAIALTASLPLSISNAQQPTGTAAQATPQSVLQFYDEAPAVYFAQREPVLARATDQQTQLRVARQKPETSTAPGPPPDQAAQLRGEELLQQFQPTASLPDAMLPDEGYFDRGAPLGSLVQIDPETSWYLLDFQNRQTDKQVYLLCDRPGNGCYPNLKLGAQARASFLAAKTTGDSQFPYLGRFPSDFTGGSATDARLLHANFSATGHFTPWAHAYTELLFSDVFTFPSFNQGSFQVRQAYLTVGDLHQSPWYAFIGKKTVSFGDMGTLSPFSQSVVWHYFGALHEGVGAGFSRNGLNLVATALNGGRGIRVADSPSRGNLNNFAANASYRTYQAEDTYFQIGGGYINGTIYDAAIPEHINPGQFGDRNAAWDVNASARRGPFRVAGEFAQTRKPWPSTNHLITAYRAEAAMDTRFAGYPSVWSLSWSEGIQGPSGTQFEFNKQFVFGLGIYPSRNTQVTFEYVQSIGFAPLINIVNVSDRSVRQHSAVIGLVFIL